MNPKNGMYKTDANAIKAAAHELVRILFNLFSKEPNFKFEFNKLERFNEFS